MSVEVIGAFGHPDDWTAPLVTLTNDGTGTFRGSALLGSGTYAYLFHVIGDSAGIKPATYARYAIDPAQPNVGPCPDKSPTYSAKVANPCSMLTTSDTPGRIWQVNGTVHESAHAASGYFVVLERIEKDSHHFFVDRATTDANGTFRFSATGGTYRLQVQHPTFYAQSDAERTPDTLDAARRVISSAFTVSADVSINAPNVAYDGYGAMAPRGDAGLPATLTFALSEGVASARAVVYGTGTTVGDPWWQSAASKATSATFDGGFNTAAAPPDATITPGARYFWGTEQTYPRVDGGVQWTAQSMVFPIDYEAAQQSRLSPVSSSWRLVSGCSMSGNGRISTCPAHRAWALLRQSRTSCRRSTIRAFSTG
jgi:hypothetical protein